MATPTAAPAQAQATPPAPGGSARPASIPRRNGPGSWTIWILAALLLSTLTALGEPRFPAPDFESGYVMPETEYPAARSSSWQYVDGILLVAALALGSWLILKRRSRRAVVMLSIFSLLYFGFFRLGCVCVIGSVQNVTLSLFDTGYVLPLVILLFFVAPLITALFFGRTFCAAVCPHGAIQDLVLLKPWTVPRWLELGLGVVPYLFLGLAVFFAATGSAFIICRYDPFISLFRLSGGLPMLLVGGGFLVASMFIGRPYCRFLCPFGVLLRHASRVSRSRVRITPDVCTQCRLCENSCPFGAIRQPEASRFSPADLKTERLRFFLLLALIPVLVAAGAFLGGPLGSAASKVHPTVRLADLYLRQQTDETPARLSSVDAHAYNRAQRNPQDLLLSAQAVQRQFLLGGWLFGGFIGLVVGVKLARFSIHPQRTDYEPDSGGCYSCARCFKDCPQERVRLGMEPAP
jgi:NosR/NirI family transcriptional regulator, nitrous oxide reductase regulator